MFANPQLQSIVQVVVFWASLFIKFSTLDSSSLFQHLGQELFPSAASTEAQSIIAAEPELFFPLMVHRE